MLNHVKSCEAPLGSVHLAGPTGPVGPAGIVLNRAKPVLVSVRSCLIVLDRVK